MKRLVVLLIAILAFAVAASPASSASPQTKRMAALEKQVKTLQAQVKALQSTVKDHELYFSLNFAGDACDMAMTADLFQSTWTVLDTKLSPAVFGPQTPITDYSACADLAQLDSRITRTPGEALPTMTAFNSLVSFLWGPAT